MRQQNQLYYKHATLTILFVGSQTQSEWENSRTPTLTTLPFAVEYLLVFHVRMIRCDKLASKKEVLLAISIKIPVEVLLE